MPTLETRVISGKGVLKLDKTTSNYKKAKVVTVYADVIRPPTSEYINYAYNPPRSRYATLNFFRKDYLIASFPLEYPQQSWDFYVDPAAQALYAVECSYAGVLQSIANLGAALGAVPTAITNQIKDWNHVALLFDTIKVVCYTDTAIKLVASSVNFDLCADQQDKEPKDPPPPPPPPTKYPPGTKLKDTEDPASEAYDSDTDGGDTEPYPDDAEVPPPPNPEGTWRFIFRGNTAGSTIYDETAPGFANDVPGVLAEPNSNCLDGNAYHIVATARGNARYSPGDFRLSTCGSGQLIIESANFSPSP